jgi:hypothetical protein
VKKPLDPMAVHEIIVQLAERGDQQGGLTYRDVSSALLPVAIAIIEQIKQRMRDDALRYAFEGDWAPMAEYIREGGRVTPQMRPFLADVLDGRIVRPAKKISKAKTAQRNRQLALFVWKARQRGEGDIPKKAEEKFGRTWRQLQKNLAALDKNVKAGIPIDQVLGALLRGAAVFLAKNGPTEPPEKEGVARFRLSDMALTPHTLT